MLVLIDIVVFFYVSSPTQLRSCWRMNLLTIQRTTGELQQLLCNSCFLLASTCADGRKKTQLCRAVSLPQSLQSLHASMVGHNKHTWKIDIAKQNIADKTMTIITRVPIWYWKVANPGLFPPCRSSTRVQHAVVQSSHGPNVHLQRFLLATFGNVHRLPRVVFVSHRRGHDSSTSFEQQERRRISEKS